MKNLSAALRPGGILFLGPADVSSTPLGFKLHGPSGHSIYQKSAPDRKKKPAAPAARPPRKSFNASLPDLARKKKSAVSAPRGEKDPIALHLRILEQMERENDREAEGQLKQLCRQFPDYLPGLYESALWNARNERKTRAQELMGEIQRRLQSRGARETILGPQDLTVDFYRISIRSFLKRAED
jgi:chemotaxis protein methyltransferase CheR